MSITGDQIRSMRLGMDLTQAEAASIVQVSSRTWAAWEAGSRNMPYSALDLFTLRTTHAVHELEAQGIKIRDKVRGLVVLTEEGESGAEVPVDVVAGDNFLDVSVDPADPKRRVVSSLAVGPNGKPYVHRTSVCALLNNRKLQILGKWKDQMEAA